MSDLPGFEAALTIIVWAIALFLGLGAVYMVVGILVVLFSELRLWVRYRMWDVQEWFEGRDLNKK